MPWMECMRNQRNEQSADMQLRGASLQLKIDAQQRHRARKQLMVVDEGQINTAHLQARVAP